jgi:hypothetical protein
MLAFETKNGKKYTFKMRDGEHHYRFFGDGKMPALLSGAYTDHMQGQIAWDRYCLLVEDNKPTPIHLLPLPEQVDALTKKDDLLALAEKNSIAIPEHMVQPKAIKKYLKGQVDA